MLEKIISDLKEAMKSGDSEKAGILRMVIAAFKNKEIENRGKEKEGMSGDDEIEVLSREVKKRREAADVYKTGGREELAQKELAEAEVIQKYLPEQLSEDELIKIIETAILKTGASSIKEMGKVMAEISNQIKGKADARLVSEIVKRKLEISNQ